MKLTDEQIIKALECCEIEQTCVGCPKFAGTQGEGCAGIISEVFDLINRQKAEIERYEKTVGKLAERDGKVIGLIIGKETEYIPNKVAETFKNMAVKQAKSEAIKEFAKRLKTLLYMPDNMVICRTIYTDEIDNLVKEMVGTDE